MRPLIILLLSISFLGCDVKPAKIDASEEYFNLEELLTKEIQYLLTEKAGIEKSVTSNSAEERTETQPSSTEEWESQLALFLDANISKPGLRGAYHQESLITLDGYSKTIYAAKNNKVAVKTFECLYQNEVLTQISISMVERNSIYTSTKELAIYFSPSGEHIIGFDVIGDEKMQLKEELHFEVKAVITY